MLRHPVLSAVVLFTSLCPLLTCRSAQAQAAPAAVRRAVRGKLLDATGRPVPGVQLFLPGWTYDDKDALTKNTVTTGADGTFVWHNTGFPYSEAASVPAVQALPVGGKWQIITTSSDQNNSLEKTRDRLHALTQLAGAHWINNPGYVNGQPSPDTGTLIVQMPDTGIVKICPRGPDGERYPNRAVEVWPMDDWGRDSEEYCWKGRTGMHGDIILPQFELDLDRARPKPLRVVLPGIGYGTTGKYIVRSNETTSVDLPPLVPLTTVTGTVPAALRKPGQTVRLAWKGETNSNGPWSWRIAPVDAKGNWTLPDLTAGTHSVYLFDNEADARKVDGYKTYRARTSFNVSGGRAPEKIVLQPRPVLPPPRSYPPAPQVAAALVGQVRNADGSAAADTDVWGLYSTSTIDIDHTATLHAKTDVNGTYRLTGFSVSKGETPFGSNTGTFVTLLATRPDSAPALAAVTVDREESHAPNLEFIRDEASLVVTVRDLAGNPTANVPVSAYANILQYLLQMPGRRDNSFKDLRQALAIQVTTDSNGTARFAHLRPDIYQIGASRPSPMPTPPYGAYGPGSLSASAEGIAVSVAQTVKHTLTLLPFRPRIRVRYIAPDGTVIHSRNFSYRSWAAGGSRQQGMGGLSMSDTVDHFDIDLQPGVWNIEYLGDAHLSGRTTVAVRSYDVRERTLDIHLAPKNITRLSIQLLDERSHPVAGAIYKAEYTQAFSSDPEAVGASDKQGRLTFTVDTTNSGETTTLRAEADGDAPFPIFTIPNTPFPSDAALMHRRRWPVETVTFEVEKTTPVRLQAVQVGWVRGHVKGSPPGGFATPWSEEHTWGTKLRYEPKTGEYLIGPLPPGPFTLSFNGTTGGNQETVTIMPGQVLHHDITLDSALADQWRRHEEEGHRLAQTPLRVVDAQNHPISGAYVFLRGPFYGGVGATRLADSMGQARPYSVPWPTHWALPYDYSSSSQTRPSHPLWMGYVPGSYGVGITSALPGGPNTPIRLTLPPPLTVSGTITVGGKPLSQTPGQIIVYARAENDTQAELSRTIATQPSADGTFALRGVTPGRYIVQAMLDSTFFSPPQTLTVSDAALPILALDIRTPGAPAVLDLGASGALGRVYPAEPIAGPLADKYATHYWFADGTGIVGLEGLSAGTHKLRLPSGEIRNVVILPEK